MKDLELLRKAVKAGQLELVEPSENIFRSYVRKSEDCLKSAEILSANKLFENSISEAYYAIYDGLTALFRKMGVKSENHTVSIILLEFLLDEEKLKGIASWAKERRIDSQYYIDSHGSEASAAVMISKAENFVSTVRFIARRMTTEQIETAREKLKRALK